MTNLVVSNTHTHTLGFHGCCWHCAFTGDPWHWVTQWDGQTKLLNRKPKTSAVRETRVKAVTHAWVTPAKQWLLCQTPPRGQRESYSCWKPAEIFFHKTLSLYILCQVRVLFVPVRCSAVGVTRHFLKKASVSESTTKSEVLSPPALITATTSACCFPSTETPLTWEQTMTHLKTHRDTLKHMQDWMTHT